MENSAWKSTLVVRNFTNSQEAMTSCGLSLRKMHTLGPWEMTFWLSALTCGMVAMPPSNG